MLVFNGVCPMGDVLVFFSVYNVCGPNVCLSLSLHRGVDYAGDVSPSLFIKSKFVPRTFSLDSCILDMLRF